ncbi:MAG: hypothetical protein [Wendovervirus sonii]|uniref:Uncharacterized protein n=1 Tax=phage Lak_Megaphage_Sonny TaxID=3109229 RepID=A0ABZ0Z5Z4_9CAUD|nr:MAG: hypothetical protein [phage Lak_Megaphage_Sonny]
MFNKQLINSKQDEFLKQLNILAKLPVNTKYNANRQIVKVPKHIYVKMLDNAIQYGEFINKIHMPNTIKYNSQWLFDVIEKYYTF